MTRTIDSQIPSQGTFSGSDAKDLLDDHYFLRLQTEGRNGKGPSPKVK